MPVNSATTQGASTIPTKSAAIRRLCIERSPCSVGARGGAADPSRIGPSGHLAHSTSAIPLLHFCVRVRSGLAAVGQSHESKYLSANLLKIFQGRPFIPSGAAHMCRHSGAAPKSRHSGAARISVFAVVVALAVACSCRCLFSAVILSASFEREGSRRTPPPQPSTLSPTKSLALADRRPLHPHTTQLIARSP